MARLENFMALLAESQIRADHRVEKLVTIAEGQVLKIAEHDRQIGELTGKLDALIQIVDEWIRRGRNA